MKKVIRAFTLVLAVLMMTMSAAAAFTPSVEQKPAPEIVHKETDEQGEPVIIVRNDEDEIEKTTPVVNLVVVPFGEREEAAPAIKENLEKAHKQLSEAKDLTEIVPEIEDIVAKINEDMLEAAETQASEEALTDGETNEEVAQAEELKVEELVVRDLIDVSLDEETLEVLRESGNYVTISFKLNVKEEEHLMVLHNYEADKWEVIPDNMVVINEDGTVDVTFTSLSPVAFVVKPAPEVEETMPAEIEVQETEAAEPAEEEPQELSWWQKFLNLFK